MLVLVTMAIIIAVFMIIIIGVCLISALSTSCNCITENTEDIIGVCMGCIIIALFCLIISGIIAGCTQGYKEKDYQEALLEKEMLEFRLQEKDENLISSNQLYEDIIAFNKSLLKHKTHHNSLWLNLFYNDKIATIDYIKLNLNS